MKKFLKGLRYFLCYVAITLATATGVVVYQSNSSTGNISNGNTTGPSVNQVENNLMEVVSNIMELESFNVSSDISILDTNKNPIDIGFDIDINLGEGFSSIDAAGNFDISLGDKNLDIDIAFVDNTFFVTTFDKNIKFTTDGLIQGIGGVLTLLDIELPIDASMLENFDVTSLLGYMGEYKEVETEAGYDITLEFMGYDIFMKCDKEFNLNAVKIEDMLIEGFEIDLNLDLTTYEETQEITKPNKTFINLDTVIDLLPLAQKAMENKFVSANIFASYQDYNLELNAKADFTQNLVMQVTTPMLQGVNFAIANNSLYAKVQNLKLKGDVDDISTIIDFINNDLKANLESISPEVVEKVTQTTNEVTTAITNEISSIDFDKILEYIDYLTITDNQIIVNIPDVATLTINIEDNNITNIVASAYGVNLEIKDICLEKQDISVDTKDFVDFEKVFPVVKTFVNTIFTKGISGTMTFAKGSKVNSLNYGLRYTNTFETSFDTTILNKTISVVTDNTSIYLAIDGVKLNVDIKEYQQILDYINNTFNQNISLPAFEMPDIDIYEMVIGAISMFDYLKAIDGGIEFSFADVIVKVISTEDYLRHITVCYNDYTFDLDITGYGEVELFDINKAEYLSFGDITNYIDGAIDFAQNNAFDATFVAHTRIEQDTYSFGIKAAVSKNGNIDGIVEVGHNKSRLPLGITLTNDALNINYEGLNVYGKLTAIDSLKNLLENVIPNYIDLNKLLKDNGIDIDEIKNTEITIPQIDYTKLIFALDAITITQDTVSIDVDLSKFDSSLPLNINITIKVQNNGYRIVVEGIYDTYSFSSMVILKAIEDFEATLPDNAINVENYLNFVETLHNTIDTRNLKLDVAANISGQQITADALVDFRSGLKAQVVSNTLGKPLTISFSNTINKLLISFANLNLSGEYKDINNIIDFVNNDLNNALLAYGLKAIESSTNGEASSENTITFADIKDILYSISFESNTITFNKDGIEVVLTITNKTISSIKATIDNIEVVVDIYDNTTDFSVEDNGFVAFDKVFPTIQTLVKTLTTKGISGKLALNSQDKALALNYALRYTNSFETSFDTTILNKTISVVTDNAKVYLAVDGVKVNVDITEYQSILDYINNTFGLNIALPTLSANDVDMAELIVAAADMIDYLRPINGGIEISVAGVVAQILSSEDYIESITISYNGYTITLDVTGYGEVELFDINKADYLSFSDITDYIGAALNFAENTSFDVSLNAQTIIDNTNISASIDGLVGLNGNVIADINANFNGTNIAFEATLTSDALSINYDGLNIYGKLTAIDSLKNLIENVIPNYVDLDKLLKDNGIDTDSIANTEFEMPAIDYKALILAVENVSLTKDTLSLVVDFAKYDTSLNLHLTLTIQMLDNGYMVVVNALYNDMPIDLTLTIAGCEDFETSIPENAINVEDYLNFVETLHNTIDSHNLALNLTATVDNYSIVADVLADFRDSLKLSLTTESLGSKLNLTYGSDIEKLLVTFGNIKISGKYDDIESILDFVQIDLNNALMSYGIDALNNLNLDELQNTNQEIDVTFEDIKDILYSIKFTNNTVSFVKDNINVTLTIENKTITNIALSIDNINISINVSDNTQAINYTSNGFVAFEDILENLTAIANVASSQALGGKVTITYGDKSYEGHLKVNYINDILKISVTSNVYGQDIKVDIIDSCVYVKLNELQLQVSWAERYDLQSYLNEKFDLSLDFDAIFGKAKDIVSTEKAFDLKDINVDFVSKLFATKNSFDIVASDVPVSIEIENNKDTNKKYLSSIKTSFDNLGISVTEMAFGQDAIVEDVDASKYHKFTDFTRYFDEIERLINASKDETTDQYTLSGGIKIYKLDENGNALVTNGVAEQISIAINELKFDATKNTFVGGIDATGSGSMYTEYLTGYDHSFDAAFDYNFIYFDYNGLRAKFSKQSNSEFITTLKKMIPTYLGDTPLTRQLISIFDMIKFDATGNMLFNPVEVNVTLDMLESFAPMLSTLRLENDNSLSLGLDISKLDPTFTEELLLNVSVAEDGRLTLKINKFKVTKDLAIDFTIFVDTADMFTVNPTGTYMDMTSIGKLLSDFDNTAQKTTTDNEVYKLNLSGKFHLKIKVSFININEDIPFNAQLVIDRNSSQLIEAKIVVNMPSIILVTDGGVSTLYLTNRLEGENILYIDRQGKKPLKSKYKASELGNNLVNVISDITAMSTSTVETFINMDLKYISGPTKAENVLKDYSCVTGVNSRDYTIGLDLRQVTLLDMMLGYSTSNPTGIVIHSKNNAFSSIDINNITLEAISGVYIYLNGSIDMSNINSPFDIISEIENLDATLFGSWGDGSLVADFVENGGSNVPNKMGITGRSFDLPVPVKEVVVGNTLEVYNFLGWSLNSDGSGTLYNGTYMFETESLVFYAVWELDTVYTQRTISFVTEYLMANNIDIKTESNISPITTYNSYDITNSLPQIADTVTIYYEDEGVSITYRYDGLFKTKTVNSDGTITYSDKFEQTVMPNENITLYASFVEVDRVYKRKLAIYDQDKTLYEGYYVEGDEIDILSLVAHKDTTRWYDDYNATASEKYTNEILADSLPQTMPKGSDLTLYVRNLYTITYTSTKFGDTKTYTQTDYQGTAISLPKQNSYENIVYKEDGTPNYLETVIYDNYYLSTDAAIAVPEYISNKNETYSAKWDYVTTSYFKVTFNVDWTRPDWWWSNGTEQSGNKRDSVATEYVLNGSTLSGTTLTKKNSIIGLTSDTNVSKYSDCKYKYGINYNFETVGWSNSGVQNVYDSSYSASYTITKDTTFYAVWGHC